MEYIDVNLPKFKKKTEKFKPNYRTFQTDIDKNSLAYSKVKEIANTQHFYKDEEEPQRIEDSIKKQRRRLYTVGNNNEDEQMRSIKRDVASLQKQIAMRNLEREEKKLFKVKRKHQAHFKHNGFKQESPRLYKYHQKYEQPVWSSPEYYRIKSNLQKKKYKLKPKLHRYELDQEEPLNSPIISRVKVRRYQTQDNTHRSQLYISRSKSRNLNIQRLFRISNNLKKVRKVANAILFVIRLRTYNERMRKRRIKCFHNFVRESLSQKLLELKRTIIQFSKPFFLTLIDQHNFSYRLHQKDQPQLKKQKVISVLKLVSMEIKCLQKFVRHILESKQFDETLYLLCKHGNYSCIEEINTNQQLNLACVSQIFGYMRSEKNLEQSAILSLVLIKILLYNILLQPDRIDMQVTTKINPQIIYSNIRLIGNILYQLFIDIQDQFLQKAPILYQVGNWIQLKKKFNFKIAESMTIKEACYQKNQLISGLASHNYIQYIYKSKLLTDDKHLLLEIIRLLHQSIVRHHLQVRAQTFIM